MACNLTISLVSESQEGTIGNDWKYRLEARIFGTGANQALIDEGAIDVPKHRLDSGKTQAPPGPPDALVLSAGEPGDRIRVDLRLEVREVDALRDDKAEMPISFAMTCPAAGASAVVEERKVSVGVVEEPSGIGHAEFKLAYRVALEGD